MPLGKRKRKRIFMSFNKKQGKMIQSDKAKEKQQNTKGIMHIIL